MLPERPAIVYAQRATVVEPNNGDAIVAISTPVAAVGAQPNAALEEQKRGAARGDAEAQFAMGMHFADGKAVDIDATQAIAFFRLAAAQNHAVTV